MFSIKYLMLFMGQSVSDVKNDNLVNYTFQYYSIAVIYSIFLYMIYFGNPIIMLWFLFGIIPILDFYIKHDLRNPTKEEQKLLKNNFNFKIPILVTIILDWAVFISGIIHLAQAQNGIIYKLVFGFVLTTFQGISINLSHEINHKLKNWERILGTLNLSKNFYMHFLIEHNDGHHKNVATPLDPATSKLNQTLYNFIPQSIKGGFISSWKIENKKCKERYGTEFTYKNRMIFFTAAIPLLPLIIWCLFGFKVMLITTIIGFGGSVFLEAINYVEHYGLERKLKEDGTYENVDIRHSWNAPHRISNYILFKLQRHSDHHENPLKPYQTLCSFDDSPTLPSGYPACFILAFVPSVWFKLMNPLVMSYKKGEKPSQEIIQNIERVLLKSLYTINFVLFGFTVLRHYLII